MRMLTLFHAYLLLSLFNSPASSYLSFSELDLKIGCRSECVGLCQHYSWTSFSAEVSSEKASYLKTDNFKAAHSAECRLYGHE